MAASGWNCQQTDGPGSGQAQEQGSSASVERPKCTSDTVHIVVANAIRTM